MSYVVYQITCAANGKRYVGYTSKTADARFREHMLNARWKRKTALYDAVRCFGVDAFSASQLAVCESHAEACELERHFIRELGSFLPSGYNMTFGGDGVPISPEQIKAAALKKRGRFSDKQREAAARRRGVKATPETRAKLSEMRRGKKHSPEHVRKRVEAFKRNRAERLASTGKNTPPSFAKTGQKRVWSAEDREAERQRALAQWTPEARAAAKERAARQWTPEARQAARERMNSRYAKQRAERETA